MVFGSFSSSSALPGSFTGSLIAPPNWPPSHRPPLETDPALIDMAAAAKEFEAWPARVDNFASGHLKVLPRYHRNTPLYELRSSLDGIRGEILTTLEWA